MSKDHEMPDDPSHDPERALDALEEDVFGTTMDQDREDETPDPDHDAPEDGTTGAPTTTESPA